MALPIPAKTTQPETRPAARYALLLSFIALALVTGVTLFGGALNTTFNAFGEFIANNI